MTPRLLTSLKEAGPEGDARLHEELIGRYAALDIINEKTGEIYVEAGQEITQAVLDLFEEARHRRAADARHRPHQCRPLHPQHAGGRQELQPRRGAARHLPRHAPGRAADAGARPRRCSSSLLFDLERYDLSPVGRVKMNMRLDFETVPDTQRTLRKRGHPRRRQGPGRPQGRPRRDRRHRSSRQPPRPLGRRADGEPVPRRPAAHGAGDPRAHELGRDRHRDAARPDQRQAGGGGGARVLRLARSSRSSWTRPTRCRRSPTSAASRRWDRAA